jgi:hypothetical protein
LASIHVQIIPWLRNANRYPWYLTMTVALEPSIERVARAGHSTVGRIDSHMLLRALLWDSVVRLWGNASSVLIGNPMVVPHRVAPKGASEVKSQAEAKFHIYCFVLH